MKLYAAYIKGVLIDQVPAESEDTALSKLKMDYPSLEGQVTFEVVDPHFEELKEETATTTQTTAVTADTTPMTVIEADELKIEITVSSGSISKEDLEKLEKAAEAGYVVAKKRS